MVASKVYCVRKMYVCVILLGYISSSCCINMGLIARLNPTVIKKYSRNQPVLINTKTEGQHITGEVLHKLQANPSLTKKSTKMTKRFSRCALSKLPLAPYLLPLIGKSPILPVPMLASSLPRSALPLPHSGSIAKLSHMLWWSKRNAKLHEKLQEMKNKGSLSEKEFQRRRNILLRI